MPASALNIKTGWVWVFSLFIFFFNTFLLPEGFTFTLLLTPVWVYLLYLNNKLGVVAVLFAPLAVYSVIHFCLGVNVHYYLVSLTVMAALIIFLVAANGFINHPAVDLDLILRDLAILNFIFAVLSIPLLFVPSLLNLVWYTTPISVGIAFPRLKLFTEEASHYSFLVAILFIYFFSRAIFSKTQKPLLSLLIVSAPLLLSFSMGVWACLLASGVLAALFSARTLALIGGRSKQILYGLAAAAIAVYLAHKYYPGNPVFARLRNVLSGADTSARGRTYEAFILAHRIIAEKSYLWGVGPGQLKLIGRGIIIQYYDYFAIPQVIRIPNAAAETIIYFGYVGFALRMALEVTLFFLTRVYKNPFRLWLFMFVFIYQFTGSYITNVAEYLVWLLVFSPVFPEFKKNTTL